MSTGLTRPDYFNWPAELAADLKSQNPQVVVIMIGANDAQDFLGPARRALHLAAVEHALRAAGGTVHADRSERRCHSRLGRHAADAESGPERADVRRERRGPAAGREGTSTRDISEHGPVTGDGAGGYTAFVTNGAGQVVNVRTPDGTH